jgi:phosphoribosylaminoimidazolecarboxamide formyltransferase/IMP cyclohydrolase
VSVNFVEKIDDFVRVKNVLISVSDKSNLDRLVPALIETNREIKFYSTGGTFKMIKDMLGESSYKNYLIQISDYTGQPEMQGGLVKTLDFKIYLGLLSETYNEFHNNDLKRMQAVNFDMVVVNLYPFQKTIALETATAEMARANIDIGGPCMLRAAAKNFLRVAALCNPSDYEIVIEELKKNKGATSLKMRYTLAQKTFQHTAEYDAAIAAFLEKSPFQKVKSCYKIMH